MNLQLVLPLALRTSMQFADFVVGDNQLLLDSLHQQRTTREQPVIYFAGASKSGRTHLLIAQCNAVETDGLQAIYLPCAELLDMPPTLLDGLEQAHLLAIDDVHFLAGNPAWEQALFSLFNRAKETNCRLLFSGEKTPTNSGFNLSDLSSRLAWGLVYRIKLLDDAGREQLLIKLSARHGLTMPPEVARYVVQRQPRDITHLIDLVEQLDKASLREKKRLTLPFISQLLKSSRYNQPNAV